MIKSEVFQKVEKDFKPIFQTIIERRHPLLFIKIPDQNTGLQFAFEDRTGLLYLPGDNWYFSIFPRKKDVFSLFSQSKHQIQRVDCFPNFSVSTRLGIDESQSSNASLVVTPTTEEALLVTVAHQQKNTFQLLVRNQTESSNPIDIEEKVKRLLGIQLTENPATNIKLILSKIDKILHRRSTPTKLPL